MITLHHLVTEVDGKRETRIVAFTAAAQFVGTIALESHTPRCAPTWQPLVVAGIRQLFVVPEFRNKGIGTRLLDRACALAEEAGCSAANLLLNADNRHLLRFYNQRRFFVCLEYPDGDLALVRHFLVQTDPAVAKALAEFRGEITHGGEVR